MRRGGLSGSPAAWVLLSLAFLGLGACGVQRGMGQSAGIKRDIILLFDADPGGAGLDLPSYAATRVVAEGASSYADRLGNAIPTASSPDASPLVIAMRPKQGLTDMAMKAHSTGRAIDWILVSPADDALAAEAAADLVVDIDSAQVVDSNFEGALERGLCELARRVATGRAKADDAAEIAAALRSAGGWEWKVLYRVDPASGVKARNHVIVSAKPRG